MNDAELLRYSRHILLPEVDLEGQEKLLKAKVAIIGLGGLGSSCCAVSCRLRHWQDHFS